VGATAPGASRGPRPNNVKRDAPLRWLGVRRVRHGFLALAVLFMAIAGVYLAYSWLVKGEEIQVKVEGSYYLSYSEEYVKLKVILRGPRRGIRVSLKLFDGSVLLKEKELTVCGVGVLFLKLPPLKRPRLVVAWDDKVKTINVRLGGGALVRVEGKHIVLMLRKRNFDMFEDPLGWLRKLDMAYEAYAELVGAVPYNGAKIAIVEVKEYPGGWAVAGNPIKWYSPYIPDAIKQINEGDWLFGILHEISHDFDLDGRWVWNPEFSANFKMVYVVERLRAKVKVGGLWYDYSDPRGRRLEEYYAMMAAKTGEEKRLRDWLNHNDAATDKFLRVKNLIGWEPFKKTYRAWLNLSWNEVPKTPEGKLNLFVYYLCIFSGKDLTDLFIEWGFPITEETVAKVREALSGGCSSAPTGGPS